MQKFLQSFKEKKNCVAACNQEGLFNKLEEQQGELEICEKALADFKESKRRAFPRFYFVSSNDLLDILSNGALKVAVPSRQCVLLFCCTRLLFGGKRAPGQELVGASGYTALPPLRPLACREQSEARHDTPLEGLPGHRPSYP